MRDETAKGSCQTTPLISHNFTRKNKLTFFYNLQLSFTVFKYWNFCFSISALVQKTSMTFYRKTILNQQDTISQSHTARQCVWEQEKMSQSQAMFRCVCFTSSSKSHASWLWWMVFNPYFFVAEKPLPMTQTCSVVNFHNLHS